MSILKAGCSFTIMDPVYPSERIINCFKVSLPSCFIIIEKAGKVPKEVEEFVQSKESSVKFMYTITTPKQVISSNVLKSVSSENLDIEITKDDIAVVTFTSGSTGLPKGVLGRHGPLTHYYPWMKETYSFTENDKFSMQSGISHDPVNKFI
jgi:non-ribosomal peptide synthetase component F